MANSVAILLIMGYMIDHYPHSQTISVGSPESLSLISSYEP